ncbi:CxC2 domain-containing protein [Favolaschia claudopus]|uniref:CxC2 domain-containing protein n=1 Tax=Favolaschia claudopus TaxID=2862362 RepID=A0AAW0ASU6_9AGAR
MSRRRKPILRGDARETSQYVVSTSLADFLTPTLDAPIDTFVERPSADGRRVESQRIAIDPPSPVKRARRQAAAPADEPDNAYYEDGLGFEPEGLNGERYDMDLGGFFPRPPSPPPKRAAPYKPADNVLHEFRALRDEYLHELLRLDGCGDASEDKCPACDTGTPTIRCMECFGELLYCPSCCVARHAENPLHRVERWNGRFFERSSLKELGLKVQLGHKRCGRPRSAHQHFWVLDLNGLQEVDVSFCECQRESEMGSPHVQLLRRRWFPATQDSPRTVMTFRMLDFFHLQTLQAKTTMYDFYTTLEKITDATGKAFPSRYREFLRITREYRHLLLLKRGGRGHALSGVNGTQPGELAIQCPACPRPDVNLPADWESAPPETSFLYILFLALDACFRLKRRLVSTYLRDPGLGTGWAYFVEYEPYRQYLLTVTDQQEMSTCSGLAALDYANTKFSRGYSATGVGMGVCARHEFVQATGVGDLQRGERYANMDWIIAAILRWKHKRLRKLVSYDIICQWWKNLKARLSQLPPLMRLYIVLELFQFVIPKMHIHAHLRLCQLLFSLNLTPGAGQTDGEGIERPWANIGAVASSTREMGPGSRYDALDDHCAYWNWCKLILIGALLRRRLDNAKEQRAVQTEAFEAFSTEQAERVEGWESMVVEFEKDPKAEGVKNPYELTERNLTEADVRLRLAQQEAEEVSRGVPSIHDISPSAFIFAGLELEDQQRRLRVQAELKKAGTTAQKIDLIALRRTLNRGIVRFRKLQTTYTPGALQALSRREAPEAADEELPENAPLMLPSALTAEERRVGCMGGVDLVEQFARDAQCSEALRHLRTQLHVKARFFTYKELHARNQGANTRARALVERNESKIRLHSEKYQDAWEALRMLHNGDVGKIGWRKLRKEDVRTMEDPEELSKKQAMRKKRDETRRRRLEQWGEGAGDLGDVIDEENDGEAVVNPSENMRQVSWIWTQAASVGSDAELEESLRIEWTKARARSKRWKEEVDLLEEEYRRVLVSYDYEVARWEGRAKGIAVGVVEEGFAQGAIAYALKQAAMYRDLRGKVEVSMTEIHQGRGKRRLPRAGNVEGGGGNDGDSGGDGSDNEGGAGARGDVYSDEEYFMGGEEDVD